MQGVRPLHSDVRIACENTGLAVPFLMLISTSFAVPSPSMYRSNAILVSSCIRIVLGMKQGPLESGSFSAISLATSLCTHVAFCQRLLDILDHHGYSDFGRSNLRFRRFCRLRDLTSADVAADTQLREAVNEV